MPDRNCYQDHNDARYFLPTRLCCCAANGETAAIPICETDLSLAVLQDRCRGALQARLIQEARQNLAAHP